MLAEFTLPFPPSVNGYWRSYKGRQILSKKAREYKKAVSLEMLKNGHSGKNIHKRLSVCLELYPPSRAKRDVDNYIKSTLDAITGTKFWTDDSIIDHLCIHRKEVIKKGKIKVKVYEAAHSVE